MRDFVRRHPVAIAVAVAVLARLPALTRPVRADEAGFLLVAGAWDPRPDSLFGPYWVDRPPALIAVFDAVDALGGVTTLRLLGALVAGLSVLLAAAIAGTVSGPRATVWTAMLTAALLSNPMIDVVAVKGELLALPCVLGSMLLTLLAVRRRSWPAAFVAGAAGALAVGLKQNLVTGLLFAGVLLLVTWRTGRLEGRSTAVLAGAGVLGAAVPVLATVAWAELAGVRLGTLWDTVYGFRAAAARVIADGTTDAPERRAWILLAIALATGLLAVLAGPIANARELWRDDPPVVAATIAVVVADLLSLAAGGSFWQDYLIPLVPGAALCTALLAGRAGRSGRTMRGLVVFATLSAAVGMVSWLAWNLTGQQEFDEVRTGEAIAASAEPGDTLMVFGGRADLQHASGMASPYPYLWSLPMRTKDPGYADLAALLAGPRAPTWLVEWVALDAWSDRGVDELAEVISDEYVEAGTACNGHPVYLLRGVDRPLVTPSC
ncbi:glycosyltransferase family 39 protein [Nocardioides sp. LMS-CY]|uniref:glycosyltransferase family 39 protein n=1 Tax=Nocardioides sp. (strain LMS-CY) TaxID=2840457 RepID=UPI001C004DD9|nr:glycosyltransferase family 39 protein [Nocardioides sp. LMS-CY]QWF23447.1 glycosyltransferase family 39 protein [Nocardioides sp. LMS-CY]